MVITVVPGLMLPTATWELDTTVHMADAPLTVSVQDRKVNCEKSPDDNSVALW